MRHPSFVVWLHVMTAFWLVTGIGGREVVLARARRADRIDDLGLLLELSGRFERWMVQPASFAVLVAGLWAAYAEDIPLAGAGSWWLTTSLVLFVTVGALVPLVFLPRGRAVEMRLEEARAAHEVTPALRAAMHDPVVAAARIYELLAIATVILLMVTKPF